MRILSELKKKAVITSFRGKRKQSDAARRRRERLRDENQEPSSGGNPTCSRVREKAKKGGRRRSPATLKKKEESEKKKGREAARNAQRGLRSQGTYPSLITQKKKGPLELLAGSSSERSVQGWLATTAVPNRVSKRAAGQANFFGLTKNCKGRWWRLVGGEKTGREQPAVSLKKQKKKETKVGRALTDFHSGFGSTIRK